jgi:serpin B
MAADGARGATAEEFARVLAADRAAVDAAAEALLEDYSQFDGSEEHGRPREVVEVADSVWVDEGFDVREEFMAAMEGAYRSAAEVADLQDPATVRRVNGWVEDRTDGLIKEILSSAETDALVVYLVNALYFNGEWMDPAAEDLTAPAGFTTADGSAVQADMMTFNQIGGGYLSTGDGTEGALLRYGSGRFALLAVMPAGGVDAVEWDGATLARWLDQTVDKPSGKLTVELPKWEADSGKLDLIPVLRAAGLDTAFDDRADLTGITAAGGIHISSVAHRAVVKVDEKGTEAAAVTGISVSLTAASPEEAVSVTFDRPFVYSVVDTETGRPLFLGVVNDPTAG